MIKNLLFDLGNVLIPIQWNKTFALLDKVLAKEHRDLMHRDATAFKQLFLEPSIQLESGFLEFHEFVKIVANIFRIRISDEEFHAIWCSMFSSDRNVVRLGTCLSEKYATYLVSNTSKAHYDFIVSQYPEICFYRDAALSYELKVMKPADEYYQKAFEKFGILPEESVFIDDLPENVKGAMRAGLHGVEFTGVTDLLKSLEQLGVDLSCYENGIE